MTTTISNIPKGKSHIGKITNTNMHPQSIRVIPLLVTGLGSSGYGEANVALVIASDGNVFIYNEYISCQTYGFICNNQSLVYGVKS